MSRRKHFAVDRLSEEGQAVVRAGFGDGLTLKAIADKLLATTEETISLGALSNWDRWQRTQERFANLELEHKAAVQLVRAIPDSRIVHALSNAVEHYLVDKTGELQDESAVELLGHFQAMQKLGLAHERVKIAEQSVKVERIKAVAAEKTAEANLTRADAAMLQVELVKQRAMAAAMELETAARASTDGKVPAEVLTRIREDIYGIVDKTVEATEEVASGS